ncbi:MAG: hypothetical protein AB4050_16955 [Synechococcus sp.]
MKATKWVSLDPLSLNEAKPRMEIIRGRERQVMLSPYDVPKAIRGKLDEDRKRFAIEFSYIGNEDTSVESDANTASSHVYPRVGKHSGRLYGIEIDTEVLGKGQNQDEFTVLLDQAFQSLGNRHKQRRGNYRVTREALKDAYYEILSPLKPLMK